jgi:hypothetical protein
MEVSDRTSGVDIIRESQVDMNRRYHTVMEFHMHTSSSLLAKAHIFPSWLVF